MVFCEKSDKTIIFYINLLPNASCDGGLSQSFFSHFWQTTNCATYYNTVWDNLIIFLDYFFPLKIIIGKMT